MPSNALLTWQNERMPRINAIDTQCAACVVQVPPDPRLVDENLRGYVLLLSAHFQGFCRNLYVESSQIIASKVRGSLQTLIQAQFIDHLALDRGNPNLDNLRKDFDRFGFTLDLTADPANHLRLRHLSDLNRWRNVAAHQGIVPPGGLSLADVQGWRNSCDGLAASLDGILYNQLRRILRRNPWVP
jgi:hypothetical protein